MDELEQLEILSLITRLTSEIENYTGQNDKTLAEFLLNIHNGSKDLKDFRKNLSEVGAEFPESFVENLDRLIRLMHPRHKDSKDLKGPPDTKNGHEVDEKTKKFRGLALPDTSPDGLNEKSNVVDDALAQLEALGSSVPTSSTHRPTAQNSDHYRSRSPPSDDTDVYGRRQRRRSRSPVERDGYRGRRRRRTYSRSPIPDQGDLDDEPILNKIYTGTVSGLTNFGAFVTLKGVKGKVDGMIHVSNISGQGRVNHPEDYLKKFDTVKVKVISIEGNRIGLSLKDVDQDTGEDLSIANFRQAQGELPFDRRDPNARRKAAMAAAPGRKKRLTSPERWEIKQLIASGVVSAEDYPDIDEDINALNEEADVEPEEDIDIEVREEEPPFLIGQTKQSLELSPIRVIKAPEGSLNRAATEGTTLAKERRELRQQQAKEVAKEKIDKQELSNQWNDPMAQGDERQLIRDLRSSLQASTSSTGSSWRKSEQSRPVSYGRHTTMSLEEQRRSLPVYNLRSSIVKAIRENQIIIIVGDTGSGKTTQITQYLAEEGFANERKIGCTQPRRVAAMSVAKRVAEEVGCELGQEVGYTIRFEDVTSPNTKIKYMTDGMLQRETLLDPDLKQYSVIMLDEAHERTIATDILFALLKKATKRRPDLRVIVTSATLDAEKFSSYFFDCQILFIPGRTYPVEILFTKEPEPDYLDAALITVMQIHLSEPAGDILVFLTGQEEIDTSCEILYERMKALGPSVPELIILPVYSALPSEMQSLIFDPAPHGARKVVLATNIAETSITIDGIYYVVDPGFVKINAFDPKLGMDSLVVSPISQAQANQRAGRAGRTGPGKCYRLYTESAYQNEMLPATIPEIQRQNLSHTILLLKAMGINDLLHFDFMDPPPTNTMLTALEELYALSALDDEGLLTRIGRKMADFPMEPALAKVLLLSVEYGCSDEVLTIVAMLSVQTVFYRPKEKQQQADQKKAKFHDPFGDHLTLLNVYNAWKTSGFANAWCFDNFIQARSMKRAQDVRKQLISIMERYKHNVITCGKATDLVRKALCTGFFRNAARKDPQEGYKTLIESTPVYLHPSSALFGKHAEYVIYHTLVLTTKEYMHCATVIDPKWLVDAAPTFFKVADADKLSKRKRRERIEPLFNRFAADPNEWRLSAQRRAPRNTGGTFG